jgi:hypothetical protein
MQRFGPPPSYPTLRIPGLNAPIPEGLVFHLIRRRQRLCCQSAITTSTDYIPLVEHNGDSTLVDGVNRHLMNTTARCTAMYSACYQKLLTIKRCVATSELRFNVTIVFWTDTQRTGWRTDRARPVG